jgi:hypothetical protein
MSKSFKEKFTTAVLTTRHVVQKGSPIIVVIHHDDGVWEFWGEEEICESDIMVIGLGELINHDPTVLEIADLPENFKAVRRFKNDLWELSKIDGD